MLDIYVVCAKERQWRVQAAAVEDWLFVRIAQFSSGPLKEK